MKIENIHWQWVSEGGKKLLVRNPYFQKEPPHVMKESQAHDLTSNPLYQEAEVLHEVYSHQQDQINRLDLNKDPRQDYRFYLTSEHFLAGFVQQYRVLSLSHSPYDLTDKILWKSHRIREIIPTYRGKIERDPSS